MPLLTIHHKTVYRYTHPVAFGEHRIMLRPRDGHDLRVLSSHLEIAPQPRLVLALPPMLSAVPVRASATTQYCPSGIIAAVAEALMVGAADMNSEEKPSSCCAARTTFVV